MRVTKVKISDILGIESLEFEAGAFNAFTGDNGEGKTSALNAVKAVLGRDGGDATLLRKGAEVGEAVLVFDDGTEITKRVTAQGTKTTINGPEGKVSATSAMLKGLTDAMSVNPVSFILSRDTPADKRQRLTWLLECLPTEIDQDRLVEIAGPAAKAASPNWSAFDQIQAVYQTIFDDRTSTNRAIGEKNASINQLEQTLPDDEGGAQVTGDAEGLQANLDRLDAELVTALEGVASKATQYEQDSAERVQKIRGDAAHAKQAKRDAIAALQAELTALQTEEDKKVAEEQAWMAETRGKADTKRAQLRQDHATDKAPIAAALDQIRAGANSLAKAAATRAHIKTFADAVRALEEDSKKMTAQLAALQDYKSELLSDIPVDGLTVDDGEIFRHGVPFDRLNTAQQVDMAVEIAKLRASRAGIICVDGMEALGSEQFALFREKAIESGLQLFVTRVTDSKFAVETSN